jgi:hypothetical protein
MITTKVLVSIKGGDVDAGWCTATLTAAGVKGDARIDCCPPAWSRSDDAVAESEGMCPPAR